jgi:hypothetical protein
MMKIDNRFVSIRAMDTKQVLCRDSWQLYMMHVVTTDSQYTKESQMEVKQLYWT